jgi:hypothetical protein
VTTSTASTRIEHTSADGICAYCNGTVRGPGLAFYDLLPSRCLHCGWDSDLEDRRNEALDDESDDHPEEDVEIYIDPRWWGRTLWS